MKNTVSNLYKDIAERTDGHIYFGIVGPVRTGKSTFVNLLNRLLDPTSGEILLDGNDITKMDKKHVRQHVGIILQEPFLYSRTIKENINIALPYSDDKTAKELARIASVDNDIESFELKYEITSFN